MASWARRADDGGRCWSPSHPPGSGRFRWPGRPGESTPRIGERSDRGTKEMITMPDAVEPQLLEVPPLFRQDRIRLGRSYGESEPQSLHRSITSTLIKTGPPGSRASTARLDDLRGDPLDHLVLLGKGFHEDELVHPRLGVSPHHFGEASGLDHISGRPWGPRVEFPPR